MGEAHLPTEQPKAGQEPRVPAPDVDPGRPRHHQGPPAKGTQAPVGLTWRIRDRETFRRLRAEGRQTRRGPLTVIFVDTSPSEPPRVAYAVGSKVGGAVVRNRLRRRLRAIVHEAAPQLPPGAYLITAAPAAAHLTFGELRTTVREILGATTDPGAGRPVPGEPR